MNIRVPRIRERDIALFLDVDGTLLDVAESPTRVVVPGSLKQTLIASFAHEDGALAFITGRSIDSFDGLFAPPLFPVAGLHGAERRDNSGAIHRPAVAAGELDHARQVLGRMLAQADGLLLEDKGTGVAVHFRLAPHREAEVLGVMTELARALAGRFMLRSGKCVLELMPSGYSKRVAIEAFMAEAPFTGRTPVFVGDDTTDEDGFAAVNDAGGYSIRVGPIDQSNARYQFDGVPAVVAWLEARYRDRGRSAT